MYKKKFIYALLAMSLSAVVFPAVCGADGEKSAVYSVTFDSEGEKYTLKEGAELTDGADGKAVRLDGEKKQYVQLADDITEKLDGDYTISVDVYPENETNFARVFDLGTGTDNFAYFTCMGGGVPKYRYKGDDLFSDGVSIILGEWNNVTITRHDGEARLFINGEVAATSRSFIQPLSALGKTDANYLGKSHFENDAYFTGMIDNFAIYDYAFADGEIIKKCGGAIEVSVCHKDANGVIAAFDGDFDVVMTVNNYTNEPITAKLVSVLYDSHGNVLGTRECPAVSVMPNVGEGKIITNTVNVSGDTKPYTVKSYIYTEMGGFEKISQISSGSVSVPSIPEDTFETTVGVHDPSIFKDPKSGVYYVYSTGMIDIFKSEDLVNWTKTTNTLPDLPQCVYDTYKHDKKEEYSNIWAPDMFYDESDTATPYHLTCSYSDAFGKNNSSIILFKSASPEGPWENGQIIFTSNSEDTELGKVNAIDSNICVDRETGQKYMVYGSFWQGIHIKELNDDGTVKDPDTVGKRIMSRKDGIGGPEGAYIVYNEDTGYYYLFTSFDSLSDTYNIRVARSKSIIGPYVDENGVDVDRFEAEDNTAVGYKLMGSWQFPMGNTYYGPGHCSVLNDDGNWFLVHHQRTVKGGYATLNVREMLWNEDGWPIVTPERYNGSSTMLNTSTADAMCLGEWDVIYIGENTNAMLTSEKLILPTTTKNGNDGIAKLGDRTGIWTITFNGDRLPDSHYINFTHSYISINFEDEAIEGVISHAWDYDENRPTIQFTGTNHNGTAVWGKKAISTATYK